MDEFPDSLIPHLIPVSNTASLARVFDGIVIDAEPWNTLAQAQEDDAGAIIACKARDGQNYMATTIPPRNAVALPRHDGKEKGSFVGIITIHSTGTDAIYTAPWDAFCRMYCPPPHE